MSEVIFPFAQQFFLVITWLILLSSTNQYNGAPQKSYSTSVISNEYHQIKVILYFLSSTSKKKELPSPNTTLSSNFAAKLGPADFFNNVSPRPVPAYFLFYLKLSLVQSCQK